MNEKQANTVRKHVNGVRAQFLEMKNAEASEVMDRWEVALRQNCENWGIDRESDEFAMVWITACHCLFGLAQAVKNDGANPEAARWIMEGMMRLEAVGLWNRVVSLEMPQENPPSPPLGS